LGQKIEGKKKKPHAEEEKRKREERNCIIDSDVGTDW